MTHRFNIVKDHLTVVKKFGIIGRKLEFIIAPIPKDDDPIRWIKNSIEDITQYAIQHINYQDHVGITFCGENQSFKERGPGWIKFKPITDLKFSDIWDMIVKIFQSNSEGLHTDKFCINITAVNLPRGKGRNTKYNNFDEECNKRKGIVVINNKDNFCLPRALVVAKAFIDKDPYYSKIRRDVGKIQTLRTIALLKESKIEIPSNGSSTDELRKFQCFLANYNIIVYQYGCKGRSVIFNGNNNSDKNLNLIYDNGHYNVITSLTSAFNCGYYCENCHVPYNSKNDHRCMVTCPLCQQSPPCLQKYTNVKCNECNRDFRDQNCYDQHKSKNICDKVKRCSDCLTTYKADRTHECNEIYCKTCKKFSYQDHLCYIQIDLKKYNDKDTLFIFYDLETQQEDFTSDDKLIGDHNCIKLHKPNLCVFTQRCDHCINTFSETIICERCGVRQHQLNGGNVIELFTQHLLNQRKIFKKVVVIAHNGRAFDHQFILHFILTQTNIKPELIMRGTKIILMQIKNIKFIDSLNYFPMSLGALPKAFDLPPVYKKGYFPHLFNTKANENYVGPLPPINFYTPNTMKPDERESFLKWYEEHKNDIFDMKKDIVDYCISDVKILTETCIKFRKLMIDKCSVCPFTEATTIASACNLVFRRKYMKEETLGIMPKKGYRNIDNQSKIAIQWILWEEKQRDINISHAANGREIVLRGVRVDGYCRETNQVFEFHGCFFHGHNCMKFNRDKFLDNEFDTLNIRYEKTLAKTRRLQDFGFDVIEMWECDFRNNKKALLDTCNNPLLNLLPLNPRDAFYGGRTENIRSYYACKKGEKIKYIDVCSLYPWVNKYGKFPIKHPEIIVGEECNKKDITKIDGFIKCKILPPQNLYHPVLPMKQNNKLIFSLCRLCSEEMNQNDCLHNEEERALTGTWVIDEIILAIKKEYRIIQIYEIWHYQTVQYDNSLKSEGLFTNMINDFVGMKQQASGWPNNCITEEDKQQYIKKYQEKENISLKYDHITKNTGLRSLAKLMLNSFWGKFGQRDNQSRTSIIKTPEEFFTMLTNPCIDTLHVQPINEDTIAVTWEYKEEAATPLPYGNVPIAAYTTAQARIKLYSYLDRLHDRVLYNDTDSVIYISREGEWDPPTGEFLGDMTDELTDFGEGSYITEFVSGGPKNYAFEVFTPSTKIKKTVCKVKGISLNYDNSNIINFESMKNMILSDCDNLKKIVTPKICCNEYHQVLTIEEQKIYRPISVKRKFTNDISYPYGYKHRKYDLTK